MALKTKAEYIESLKKLKPNIYMLGEKVDKVWDNPLFQSTLNLLGATHDFSFDPEYKALSVVHSPLINEPVRRLNSHIQTAKEDAVIKAKLTREVTQRRICTWCQSNLLCMLWAATYDTDQRYKTSYHERLVEYAKYVQKNDLDFGWAMMDPKGDRGLRSFQQRPPTDLRIVDRNEKGIVVKGAKVHTSYGPVTQELAVAPCRSMTKEDKDFAVSFAVPVDTKGITFIARPSPGPLQPRDMEGPIGSTIGGIEAMTVFDDVFVPWERVFLCGEWDMCDRIPFYFASIQRHSKCACLAGHTDMIIGIIALTAQVNGLGMRVAHIRDKLTKMMMQAEAAYGCAIGAAEDGSPHPSGLWIPNALIGNSGFNYIRSLAGDHLVTLHDIAGGIIVTMPTELDYKNPATKEYMDTYLHGSNDFTAEERLRVLSLAQEVGASRFTGYFLGWAINASGSPMANEIAVRAGYDLDKRIKIAKGYAKIKK